MSYNRLGTLDHRREASQRVCVWFEVVVEVVVVCGCMPYALRMLEQAIRIPRTHSNRIMTLARDARAL